MVIFTLSGHKEICEDFAGILETQLTNLLGVRVAIQTFGRLAMEMTAKYFGSPELADKVSRLMNDHLEGFWVNEFKQWANKEQPAICLMPHITSIEEIKALRSPKIPVSSMLIDSQYTRPAYDIEFDLKLDTTNMDYFAMVQYAIRLINSNEEWFRGRLV